jgi:hypothetical protein
MLTLLQPASRPVAAKQVNPGIFARFGAFPFRLPGIRRSSIRSGPWRHATDRQENERSAGSSYGPSNRPTTICRLKLKPLEREAAHACAGYHVFEVGDIRPPPR